MALGTPKTMAEIVSGLFGGKKAAETEDEKWMGVAGLRPGEVRMRGKSIGQLTNVNVTTSTSSGFTIDNIIEAKAKLEEIERRDKLVWSSAWSIDQAAAPVSGRTKSDIRGHEVSGLYVNEFGEMELTDAQSAILERQSELLSHRVDSLTYAALIGANKEAALKEPTPSERRAEISALKSEITLLKAQLGEIQAQNHALKSQIDTYYVQDALF